MLCRAFSELVLDWDRFLINALSNPCPKEAFRAVLTLRSQNAMAIEVDDAHNF